MLKKCVAAAAVIGALGFTGGPALATACVHAHVQVNDTVQDADQCV